MAASLTAVATPSPAAAQRWADLSSLRPGDTLRVWATGPRLNGTVRLLDRLERDTLALTDLAGRGPRAGLAVPILAVTRLDVRRGQRRSVGWSAAGVVLGAALGTVVGAYTGVLIECRGSCSDENGDLVGLAGLLLGGTVGAATGAIAGGIIGARRRANWQPVGLPRR